MASIFDKYKATSTKVMKKLMDEEDAVTNRGKFSDRLELNDGLNKIRFGPKHQGEEHFMHMRGCHWVTIEIDGQPARRTVSNARIHLGIEKDPIELYIERAKEKLSTGEADDVEKLKKLTDWKGGMNLSTTWYSYAKVITGEKRGPWEVFEYKRSVRDALKDSNIIEDESEAIEMDCVSGPLDGRCALITYNSKAKTAKDYYKLKLSDKITKLTQDEMEAYDRLIPISKLPEFNYSISDYDLAIEGLKYFDESNEISLFDDEDFVAELAAIKKEIKGKSGHVTSDVEESDKLPFDDENTQQKSKKGAKSAKLEPKKPAKGKKAADEEDEEIQEAEEAEEAEEETEEIGEEGDEFDSMDREALKAYKVKHELEIKIFTKDTDDDIRAKIREAVNLTEPEEAEEEDVEDEPIVEQKGKKPGVKILVKEEGKKTLTLDDIRKQLTDKTKKK